MATQYAPACWVAVLRYGFGLGRLFLITGGHTQKHVVSVIGILRRRSIGALLLLGGVLTPWNRRNPCFDFFQPLVSKFNGIKTAHEVGLQFAIDDLLFMECEGRRRKRRG